MACYFVFCYYMNACKRSPSTRRSRGCNQECLQLSITFASRSSWSPLIGSSQSMTALRLQHACSNLCLGVSTPQKARKCSMSTYRCQRGARPLQHRLRQLLKLLASHAAAEVNVIHEALHIHRRLRDGAQHLFQLRANHITHSVNMC